MFSCATSEPSAFITKICVPPPTWPTKAIFDPSGDHAGIVPVVLVSCVKPEPSVPMTAMTDGPGCECQPPFPPGTILKWVT